MDSITPAPVTTGLGLRFARRHMALFDTTQHITTPIATPLRQPPAPGPCAGPLHRRMPTDLQSDVGALLPQRV